MAAREALGVKYIAIMAVLAGLIPCVIPQTSLPADSVVAIRDVTVLPMDSTAALQNQTVVVRCNRIERIGPAKGIAIPLGATVADGRGKYLLPGLADMHVHLAGPDQPPGTAEAELILYLANGVTTVRNMRGFPEHLALRDRVARGELPGPNIITAGPGPDGESAKSPTEGEQAVREQKRLGYDLVKVLPGLSLTTYDAIARTSRAVAIPFAGHVPAAVGVMHAIDMGQQTIEHLDGYIELRIDRTPLTRERVGTLVRRTLGAGVWNVPTMAVMEANLGVLDVAQLRARPELAYIPDAMVQRWIKMRAADRAPKGLGVRMQRDRMLFLKALNESYARILFGTDSPQLFNVPGFSVYHEMEPMGEAGTSNYETLRSATEQVGEYTGKSCGVVWPGACADLILVDGNPLADLKNLRRLSGIVTRGRWIPWSDLERRLKDIRERPGNYRVPAATP
jgi:imidazolonepropionase-like amidohydrolase